MAKSIRDIPKKRRGRPKTTGRGEGVMVRLHADSLVALDSWAASQDDEPSRPEAIRRLVEVGLAHQPLEPGKPHRGAARAKEMALEVMRTKLAGVSEEERVARKARLMKRPGQKPKS